MPIYEYSCSHCRTQFERYLPVSHYKDPQDCPKCSLIADRKISIPMMVSVQADISYESPTTGKMINSYRARAEDLAESNCVPYDPDQKQDHIRNIKEADERLENTIMKSVDKEIAALPAKKREKLNSEMESGATAEIVRL